MHNKKLNFHESILDLLSNFIKFSFEHEGKLVIDVFGKVLLCNNENLDIGIKEDQDLIEFLKPFLSQISLLKLQELKSTNIGFDEEFFEEKTTQFYRVLIAPILVAENDFFLVQILNITSEKNATLQLAKQRKRVENEMLLRTREIIMTDEAMSADGGFLSNFLRGLRHDLVSPITQLQEIIQYYQKAKDPQKKEKSAALINGSLQKLSNTAKGFSDFVDLHFLPQIGEEELFFENIYQTTCAILEAEIKNSNAQINVDFTRADTIVFNKNMLESIFYNLLSNAIKFRKYDRNLEIQIETFTQNGNLVLAIKDNGIGIDIDKYGHTLFVPFKRQNMDRPGAGIGLSLIKNVLEKNNGKVEMKSQLGKGSKVIVTFFGKESL